MMFHPINIRTKALTAVAAIGLALLAAAPASAADATATPAAGAEAKFSAADLDFFEKQVRPILAENCFKCHNDKKQKGNLRLDARAFVLKGGDHGPLVDPANPDKGTLGRAIGYADEDMQMPPDGKLPQDKIDVLLKWAKAGAPWPSEKPPAATVVAPGHAVDAASTDPEKNRDYWAYKAPVRPAVPQVKDPALQKWVKTPPDAFIASKLEARGLKPADRADKVALVRRAYYDLLGLAPTPEEVDAFVNDAAPDAWEKLVDKLLASPHYGEKWGRHWLDLVRYAESHGYERDSAKPQAWRYRDYVIRSFNTDKPYDVFLKEQLAGDELDTVTTDSMIATGYYRLGTWDDEPADRPLARYDMLDGVVSTTASVVLGMSVGCARCHDHKRDPITAKDYYSLMAFFNDVGDMNAKNTKPVMDESSKAESERMAAAKAARDAALYQDVYAIEQKFIKAMAAKGTPVGKGLVSDLDGLTFKFYRDTFTNIPDFAAVKFEADGPVASNLFTLAPASRNEAIGLVFEGNLKVPAAGDYTFHIRATEGVRITVGGKVVANQPNKGTSDSTAKLAAGVLPIKLEYYNGYAQPRLDVAWSGPGFERRPLSDAGAARERVIVPDARTAKRQWTYVTAPPAPGVWYAADYDVSGWRTGPGGFGRRNTPGAVVGTPWTTNEIWMRQAFELTDLPSELSLDVHHDEEIEVFLNGTRVFVEEGHLREYKRVKLDASAVKLLKKGTNLLAAYGRNTAAGQYMDVGLVEEKSGGDLGALIAKDGPATIGAELTKKHAELSKAFAASRLVKAPEAGIEVMCVSEPTRDRPAFILIRGNPGSEGDRVVPAFPQVLTPPGSKPPVLPGKSVTGQSTGKRRVLAEWLASDKNPLTARVMANRVFQYHFGRGIFPSPNETGKLGEPSTHPELLDWLATELVANGWKLKPLHKLLMMSNAYQMSSRANADAMKVDPANELFWRFNMRRLGAEEVRDSILAASGTLNQEMFGPPVYPVIPKEVLAGQSRPGEGWGKSTPEQAARRSVYVHVKRSLLVPILNIHDQADTDSSCPVRFTTTVPTQALGMLNGEFTNEQAGLLAARLTKEAPGDLKAQVKRAIRLTAGRQATDAEVAADVAFVEKLKAEDKLSSADALRVYCLMALNTNEFIYLD